MDLNYDGCVCCINLPDAKMPMTIVPMVNPAMLGTAPANFNPTEIGSFHVDVVNEGSTD